MTAKPEANDSKWKMMFAKDSKKEIPIPKQYAFPCDDEPDSDKDGRDSRSHRKSPDRKTTSSYASTSSRSRYETKHSPAPQPPPPVMSGPSVLDKFGSFRRAANVPDKPPEPPAYRRSRSRSRSRSASRSRSRRSRSRSSRSRSYGGRRSRSYSRRSYSRSRSRSGSFGGSNYRRRWRGSNYRPRGNNYRVGQFNRSNNFRDFKNRGRDRWNRGGNGWGNRGGGGRYRNFRDDSRERRFDRRSASYSPERRRSNDRDRDRRSPPPLPANAHPPSPPKENPFSGPAEQSVEEIERMLEKAKKEKQEEMIERNRDLVKTTQWITRTQKKLRSWMGFRVASAPTVWIAFAWISQIETFILHLLNVSMGSNMSLGHWAVICQWHQNYLFLFPPQPQASMNKYNYLQTTKNHRNLDLNAFSLVFQ